jgi:hypothetical protein
MVLNYVVEVSPLGAQHAPANGVIRVSGYGKPPTIVFFGNDATAYTTVGTGCLDFHGTWHTAKVS